MTAAVVASSAGIASPLLPRVPPRALIAPGLLVATAGLVWLTQLHPDSAYATHALPAEILTGLGIGCVFVPVFSLATQGVAPHETGIASAMVNTANQVGGSIGTALLNTIAASATAGYLAAHARGSATAAAAQGLVHGYTVAIASGAGILAAAALLATIMITAGRPPHPGDNARPTARARALQTASPCTPSRSWRVCQANGETGVDISVRVDASIRRGPGRGGPGAAAGRKWRPGCGRRAPAWPGCWRRAPSRSPR